MLSRPDLDDEALPYWNAFQLLSRDRKFDSLSLGMAGGTRLPCVIPRDAVRSEGERTGFAGEGLDDFIEIVVQIDDLWLEIEMQRIAADLKASAAPR